MSSQQQIPSIGRVVHYQRFGTPGGEYTSKPRAAIITAIPDDVQPDSAVSLVIMNPTGLYFTQDVPFSETPKPGHWSWPPRV